MGNEEQEKARNEIRESVKKFFDSGDKEKFVPGKSRVQYAGTSFGSKEVNAAVESLLGGWLGLNKKGRAFEIALAKYIGSPVSILANSGSSANLLAVSALKSEHSPFKMKEGDEIIVPACAFPTTVNPIIQNGFVPVFIDVELGTYNPRPESIRKAIGEKTKAVFVTHMFGIPNKMDEILEIAEENDLIVLEDNCDALGSSFKGKKTGSFGAMSTYSFYPAHHITMGEGGAIAANQKEFEPILRSLRDWGRACVCPECPVSVDPNFFCQMRFDQKVEGLPEGYDKKYIYTSIGYNLKPTEMQAAIGLEQIKKVDDFKEARQKNFARFSKLFSEFDKSFLLPTAPEGSDVSWFCLPLTIKDKASFSRPEIISFLEKENNIETRLFFSSSILKQPAYKNIKCRIAEKPVNSDKILENSFFIGVYPGITSEKAAFVEEKVREFMKSHGSKD